jgi:hypothetical protein
LSSNWRKIQASLNASKSKSDTPLTKTPPHHGLKRKRDQLNGSAHRTSAAPAKSQKPRKRNMAQHGDASSTHMPLRQVEETDYVPRPRLSSATYSDKANAGLSSE